jgi:hypothetical protein
MTGKSIAFSLRDIDGRVDIAYGINDDPKRWGFHLFGPDWDIESARGFPVLEARVRYRAEGYAAFLGWIQVARFTVRDDSAPEAIWAAPDIGPRSRDADGPYTNFGIEPVFFDATASDASDEEFLARTFLTYTPDCLVSRVVEPLCGFTWGYDIEHGTVRPRELRGSSVDDWLEAVERLRLRLPTWTFGGDKWQPPAFDD